MQNGFKIRKIDGVSDRSPRSPLVGNDKFEGPENHLPGGGPEMVVDSVLTKDGGEVTTISEVTSE